MGLRKLELMHYTFGVIANHYCRECKNLCSYSANRKWYKCSVYGETSSDASDWRLSYTACGMFNKDYDGFPIINLVKREKSIREKAEINIEGQMKLEIAE